MICALPTSKLYQEVEQAYGKEIAVNALAFNNANEFNLAPNGKESKLYHDLVSLTGSTEKATIYKILMFSQPFIDKMGEWYRGKGNLKLDENSEPAAGDVIALLYGITQQGRGQFGNAEAKLKDVMNKLSKSFGIEVEYTTDVDGAGRYNKITGKIEVNPDQARLNTPFHEFAHPFITALKTSNKALFDKLLKEVPKDVAAYVDSMYSEDKKVSRDEEKIVTHLGDVAAEIHFSDKKTLSDWLYQLYEGISDLIFKITGYKLPILTLAKDPFVAVANRILLSDKPLDKSPVADPEFRFHTLLYSQGVITREGKILDGINPGDVLREIKEKDPLSKLYVETRKDGMYLQHPEFPNFQYSIKFDPKNKSTFNPLDHKKSEADPDTYISKQSKDVYDSAGKVIRGFNPNPDVAKMSDPEYKNWRATNKADKLWKDKDKDTKQVVNEALDKVTYDEAVAIFKRENEKSLVLGRAYHKMMEAVMYQLLQDPRFDQVIKEAKDLSEQATGDRNTVVYRFEKTFLAGKKRGELFDTPNLLKTLRMQHAQDQWTEVEIVSEELRMAGTIDIFSKNNDGSYSIKDFKSGIITDLNAGVEFNFTNHIIDTKTLAEVQIALYALMIKSKDKNAKFRDTGIINITKDRFNFIDMNWERALEIIKKNFENDSERAQFVKDNPALFDAKEYQYSILAELHEQTKDKSDQEAYDILKKQLANKLGSGDKIDNAGEFAGANPDIRTEVEALINLRAGMHNKKRTDLSDPTDMSGISVALGYIQRSHNSALQGLSSIWSKALYDYNNEMFALQKEHDRLLRDVMKETDSRLSSNVLRYLKTDIEKYVGFMWVKDSEDNRMRFIQETDPQFANQVNTKAKKAYYKFYKKAFLDVSKEAVENMENKVKAQANMFTYLSDVEQDKLYTIYTAKTTQEKLAIQGFRESLPGSKKEVLESVFNQLSENDAPDIDYRIPIRNTNIKEQGKHSLDTEFIFTKHMSNMLWKKHMDPTIEIFNATAGVLPKDDTGKDITPNNRKFIENFVDVQLLNKKKHLTKGWPISYSIKNEDGTTTKVRKKIYPLGMALDLVRRATTYSVLIFRPILMIRNGLMEMTFNIIEGGKGSLTKRALKYRDNRLNKSLGIKITDTDEKISGYNFTTSDLYKAHAIVAKAAMPGSKLGKKIKNLENKYKLKVDITYEYNTETRNLDQSMLRSRTLFITSIVGEELAAKTTMVAAMINDGMWDKYDEEGNYIGEKRGSIRTLNGYRDLKGYEPEEIERIREVITRVHGTYSKERSSLAEAYAVGRSVLQFKKYLINYGYRLLDTQYDNRALGRFVQSGKFNENDKVFEWEGQIEEGSLRLLFRMMALVSRNGLNILINKELQKEMEISPMQLAALNEIAVNMVIYGISVGVTGLFFSGDDDDKNRRNILYRELTKLRADMVGIYNPMEWGKSIKAPSLGMVKVVDGFDALIMLLNNEVYKTNSKVYGYKKGESKGLAKLKRTFMPLNSTLDEFYTLWGSVFPEDVSERYRPAEIVFKDESEKVQSENVGYYGAKKK